VPTEVARQVAGRARHCGSRWVDSVATTSGPRMARRAIDLEELPGAQARAIAEQVEFLRRLAGAKQVPVKRRALPVWSLGVIGKLTHAEIYGDRV
jgi:hypothetical protein